ncbi:hypothetical protein E4U54_001515 [Claviceps lovelessii]|nr:hypothetical protein E4U54_001515 [Claviceps lovelessii]
MAVLVGPWFRESRPLWLASAVVTGVNWLENPVRWSCLLGMGLELDRADCFFAEGCRLGGAAKECVTPQLVARKHHGRGGSKDSGACSTRFSADQLEALSARTAPSTTPMPPSAFIQTSKIRGFRACGQHGMPVLHMAR